MKKNRIQVNGVWYVKEEQVQIKEIEMDPVWFDGCVAENGEVVFEATRILRDDYTPYSDYYECWIDYFYNLLLHNYFFEDTAYKLIGFTKENNQLFAVIEQ